LKVHEGELSITPNDGQKVVKIMGNPACQLTNRLHLLRLSKLILKRSRLLLGPLALGDVLNGGATTDYFSFWISEQSAFH
jgi:hypothetical protein